MEIGFKLIKSQLCEAKWSVMKVGSKVSAASKMELLVTIFKDWKLLKIVTKGSILDVTKVLDPVSAV